MYDYLFGSVPTNLLFFTINKGGLLRSRKTILTLVLGMTKQNRLLEESFSWCLPVWHFILLNSWLIDFYLLATSVFLVLYYSFSIKRKSVVDISQHLRLYILFCLNVVVLPLLLLHPWSGSVVLLDKTPLISQFFILDLKVALIVIVSVVLTFHTLDEKTAKFLNIN